MIDTKAIRAAAGAAPKDMLHVRHDFGAYYSLRHYPGDYYQGRVRGKERADFIATANPETVIALLDRLEAQHEAIVKLRMALGDVMKLNNGEPEFVHAFKVLNETMEIAK